MRTLALFAAASLGTSAESFSSTGILLLVLAAAGVVGAVVAFLKLKESRRLLAELGQKHQDLLSEQRELRDKQRQAGKKLEGSREEAKRMKQDLAAQRKRNHSLTEELKELSTSLRNEVNARERAQRERPAFAAEESEKKVEVKAPQPAQAPSPAPEPQENTQVKELETLSRQLEEELNRQRASYEETRKALQEQKADVRAMRRKVEQYRRVDLISKKRMELLEDKIKTLGRQYYDSVSELAAIQRGQEPAIRATAPATKALAALTSEEAELDRAEQEVMAEMMSEAEPAEPAEAAEESVAAGEVAEESVAAGEVAEESVAAGDAAEAAEDGAEGPEQKRKRRRSASRKKKGSKGDKNDAANI